MRIKSLRELQSPDELSLKFGPWGLGGPLDPETAARFQQEQIADCDLVEAVAEPTREAFERLRRIYAYGVLSYDFYTLVHDQAHLIRERALRDRFMRWCGGSVTFEDAMGHREPRTVPVSSYEEVFALAKSLRSRRGGPMWRLRVGTEQVEFNGMLAHLSAWARRAGLLRGQRARHVEEVWCDMRNFVAHGAYGIEMPVQAARVLRDLAEFINQLWGTSTPGGRRYPAAVPRVVAALSWNETEHGVWSVDALREPSNHTADTSAFLLVRAVARHGTRPVDQHLLEFDSRFETTQYPSEFLWGPGSRTEALAWLDGAQPQGDAVEYLDRVLLVREHNGIVYPPMRPEAAAGIEAEHRPGRWHAVRADFPIDAFAHARSILSEAGGHGQSGADCPAEGCSVHVLGAGTYKEALTAAAQAHGQVEPERPRRVAVPRPIEWPSRF